MNLKEISTEVRDIIDANIAQGNIVEVAGVVTLVIANHDNIEGDDVEFYQLCAAKYVKSVVKRCVGKYDDASINPDAQLVLDGFDYLQKAYSVERAGVNVLVPVDLCTDIELMQRAEEFEQMAKGCRQHALEIRDFVSARTGTQEAA